MRKGVPTLWSVGTSCLLDLACVLLLLCHHAAAAPTASQPPFVFVPVDMSTTFTTSVVALGKLVTKINKINKNGAYFILFLLYGSGFVDFH